MGFLIACDNKGCGQMQSAYLDKGTNEVYCSICDQVINNVSDFTKQSMRSLAQYRPKEKETFSVKCVSCNKEGKPQLLDNQIACSKCGEAITNLTPFFITMLKEKLKGDNS